jgi:hypothetical protein
MATLFATQTAQTANFLDKGLSPSSIKWASKAWTPASIISDVISMATIKLMSLAALNPSYALGFLGAVCHGD